MKKIPITYITCCGNGMYGLKYLLDKGHNITTVVTISPEVGQKNLVSGYVEIAPLCKSEGIRLIELDNYVIKPENLPPDKCGILVVNGWNRLIKKEVISMFEYGGLGIHAGHPPIGHGRAPLPWNIIKGFKEIEVYIFKLTEHADDGNILAINTIEITPHDTVKTLYEKVMYRGAMLFDRALNDISNDNIISYKQQKNDIISYPKRTPEDGLIDFTNSVDEIYNFIRAQSHPYPGAFTFVNGKKWHIWKAIPFDCHSLESSPRVPGSIVVALPSGIVVQTGSSPLWILEAEYSGKKVIPLNINSMEQYVGARFSSDALKVK